MSNIIGNRNSTPETSSTSLNSLGGSSLRPPQTRTLGGSSGHHLRASADMGHFGQSASSPLATRGIRPSSEVYFHQFQQGGGSGSSEEMTERAAQQWIADIDQYETTLEDMAAATLDQDFKDELSAIEQWFRVLSEPERTAALYALLQQTTHVQIRFFIQVLQQMTKNHPMSGVLSPATFGEKDPMSARMTDAMSKLNVEGGSRGSFGFGGSKPPPSPGAKRMSTLDPHTIKSMFPDAANAIEDQKAEFQKTTGSMPKSNRNSTIGDRSSMYGMPSVSAPEEDSNKRNGISGIPSGPWRSASSSENQQPIARPKSSSSNQYANAPMGHFNAPPQSARLPPTPRAFPFSSDNNIQSQTIDANSNNNGMSMLSPAYAPGASWASMTNTPMVANFSQQQSGHQADMVANATAMKLAALSTVNNRLQLDDPRKFRRTRSQEGSQQPMSPGMPSNIMMTNEHGQVLTPQQAAILQQQAMASMQGQRSRPNSPGIAITGPPGSNQHMAGMMPPHLAQQNGYLAAYDGSGGMGGGLNNGMAASNPNFYMGGYSEGYLSDAGGSGMGGERGRSPRGRRGSSKPPEDPTDLTLLSDIPNWLRTLRLHKYTDNLKDMQWQDLVALDDAGLEAKGVAAKGARSKLLKVFEQVQAAQKDGNI